jgi:hypothetical protein
MVKKIIKPTARLAPIYINGCSKPNKWRPTPAYDLQLIQLRFSSSQASATAICCPVYRSSVTSDSPGRRRGQCHHGCGTAGAYIVARRQGTDLSNKSCPRGLTTAYDHAAGDHGRHRHHHREAGESIKHGNFISYESGCMTFFHKQHFKLYFPRWDSD